MVLLDVIIEAVGDSSSGALRDFSSRCLAEFLQWSVKQSVSKPGKGSLNAKPLFKRLYSLALHPDPFKRLGCALTMKKLYRVLREDPVLVDEYLLEIMHTMIFSLRLASNDALSLGTVTILEQVCDSLGQIVVAYKDKLATPNTKRRMHKDISSFLKWNFQQVGRVEAPVRRVAFKFVLDLSPLVTGITTSQQWIGKLIASKSINFLIKNFEDFSNPPVNPIEHVPNAQKWFAQLDGSIEAYVWCLSHSMIKASDVFAKTSSSKLLPYLFYFNNNFALMKPTTPVLLDLSPLELDAFMDKRNDVVLRMIKLLLVLIEKHDYLESIKKMINEEFWKILFGCLFRSNPPPKLNRLATRLCYLLTKQLHAFPAYLKLMHQVFGEMLKKNSLHLGSLNFQHGSLNLSKVSSICNGFVQLLPSGIIPQHWESTGQGNNIKEGARMILTELFDHSGHYDPLELVAGTQLLQLALKLDPCASALGKFLLDETTIEPKTVQDEASPVYAIAQTTKGEQFYLCFREALDEHILANLLLFSTILFKNIEGGLPFRIFLSLIEKQAKRSSKNDISIFLPQINTMKGWIQPTATEGPRENALEFCKKIISLNPSTVLSNPQSSKFVCDLVTNFLSRKMPLSFKNEVLDLLPSILTFCSPEVIQNVVSKVTLIISYDFPMTSTDFQFNSNDSSVYNEYITGIDKLFEALRISKSLVLLEALFPLLKEQNHTHKTQLSKHIANFIAAVNEQQAEQCFHLCFNTFLDQALASPLRMLLVREFCLPLLFRMSVPLVIQIFSTHIKTLMEVLTPVLEADALSLVVGVDEAVIVRRLGALNIIQSMYECLSPSIIRDQLNHIFHPQNAKGNELNTAVMRAAHAIKSEGAAPKGVSPALLLEYHCTAYNALASVVICTQQPENFFTVFCFKANPQKNEKLWENIIDMKAKYEFEAEGNFPFAKKELLSLYNRTVGSGEAVPQKPVHYISSHYLADSSLSMDVVGSPFFGTNKVNALDHIVGLTSDILMADATPQRTQPAEVPKEIPKKKDLDEETIELDIVNTNPCMIKLIAVIEEMQKKFGEAYTPDTMPKWMVEIHTKAKDPQTHINIKVFLLKLILNAPHIFEPYASQWFPVIVNIVKEGGFGKYGFNYFVRDLCLMFLKWEKFVPNQQLSGSATNFVKHLMTHTAYGTREVLRTNLKIVKLFVERWRGVLSLDRKGIYDHLSYKKATVTVVGTGLQLFSILLANDFPFYDAAEDTTFSEIKFIDALLTCLFHPKDSVYLPAAEVVALGIQKTKANGMFDDGDEVLLEKMVKERITQMFGKEEHDRCLKILHAIGAHYPAFLRHFLLRVFSQLKRYPLKVQIIALQLVRDKIDEMKDLSPFLHIQPFINDLLGHRNDEVQALTLEVVRALLPGLDQKQVAWILPTMTATFPAHKSSKCRTLFYESLIWIYDHFSEERKSIQFYLMQGFEDVPTIAKKIYDFWDSNDHLPADSFGRLKYLMGNLFFPQLERSWIICSGKLILNLLTKGEEFEVPMFESLENCVYQDLQIDADWQLKGTAGIMTPLFSTQSSQSSLESYEINSQDDSLDLNAEPAAPGGLRATQPRIFPSTQSGAQTQFATYHNTLLSDDIVMGSYNPKKTVMIKSQTQSSSPGPQFKKPLPLPIKQLKAPAGGAMTQPVGGSSLEQVTVFLQRRFSKNPNLSENFYFQQLELNKRKRMAATEKKRQQRRWNQVNMLRQYRQGELPDVRIKPSEIINPIQLLIQKDHTLAKLVFSKVAVAVSKNDNTVSELLIKQLKTSTTKDPPFVNSLLHLCYHSTSPIKPDPLLVVDTAIQSQNFHMGIMLLEKMVMDIQNGTKDKSGKLPMSSRSRIDDIWHQLARLYKALGEEDILLGLHQTIAKEKYTKDAFNAELEGDYARALKIYDEATSQLDENLIETPVSEHESNLWENSRLECMMKLTRWEVLAQNTMAEVDDKPSLLWDKQYKIPYLGHYINSYVNDTNPNTAIFEEFFRNSTPEQKDELAFTFPSQMAHIHAMRKELGVSQSGVSRFYDLFLSRWSSLPELAFNARHHLLQSLQYVQELNEFVEFILNDQNFRSLHPINALIAEWRNRYPSPKYDSIVVWDNIVTQRSFFFERLGETFKDHLSAKRAGPATQTKIDFMELKLSLIEERDLVYHRMAAGARKQSNFYVTEKYVKLSSKSPSNAGFNFPFFYTLIKLHVLKAKKQPQDKCIPMLVQALHNLERKKDEPTLKDSVRNTQKFYCFEASILHYLFDQCGDNAELIAQTLASNIPEFSKTTEMNLKTVLIKKGYQSFSVTTKSFSDHDHSKFAAKNFLAFGLFCDDIVQDDNNVNKTEFKSKLVTLILQAIARGSSRARDKFPRLLQLIVTPEVGAVFESAIKHVPNWMTLGWTSQMMALLDKPEGKYIMGLLHSIAKKYPQAIYYPFSISSENISESLQDRLAPLKELLNNDLLSQFIAALEKMTHPEHRFKDWADALKPMLAKDKKSKLTAKETKAVAALWSQVYEDCFNDKQAGIGSYNKTFAKTYQKPISAAFGQTGQALVKMDQNQFNTAFNEIFTKMREGMGANVTCKQNLTEFSVWLNNFEQTNFPNDKIELPGQYDGKAMPTPELHKTICSFDGSLLVMGSMRKPKRLKMRGNDEKDYPFLVKGGEDLRLDQRVEQIFSVINQILASDANASKRKLRIHTYNVIPMTNRVGIIEWIDGTTPLKKIIEDELVKEGVQNANILKVEAAKIHQTWLKQLIPKNKKVNGVSDEYYNMFVNATRDQTVEKVLKQEKTVPFDLLKKGIMSLCSGPESYFLLRSHFAQTLAAFSIASYTIGIGDRHLDNFLLNMQTGGIIGIDFGHAFGTATQFLPIPELMPFRLTRQLTNFLLPLDTEGLLKHNMVHTLSAIQKNKDILINTMDVFVKEPLLDWEKLARRLASAQGGGDASTWFPQKKIEIAKRKLNNTNPAYIMWNELMTSTHEGKPYLPALKAVIMGDQNHNIRARVKEKCADIKEQVDCLVDQATDPNILGRTWAGWAAYI